MKTAIFISITLFLIIAITNRAFAQLKVSRLFKDHMVIQRDQPVTVWGWNKKGKKVTVSFDAVSKTVQTDNQGAWNVVFPAMNADNGIPHKIRIQSGKDSIKIADVVIGDVWLCSGQSNMEWPLKNTIGADAEIRASNDPYLRHFKVPQSYANTPEDSLAGGKWQVSSPTNSGNFTAVGYYFAKNLRKDENIPIGLLNSSWGGSRIEPWMSAQALQLKDPLNFLEKLQSGENDKFIEKIKKLKKLFPGMTEKTGDFENDTDSWAMEDVDPSDWQDLKVPSLWESQGYPDFDGIVWYRTTFELTNEEALQAAEISLGMIDDSDITWVNEHFVGETIQQYNKFRNYQVNAGFLKPGINTIAIRVDDTGGGGGIYGEAKQLFVKTADRTISLAKDWKIKIEAYRHSIMDKNQVPTLLYNKMIYPVLRFPIKGVIWYQGESNANNEKDAYAYRILFANMIRQWRRDWKIGDFPFLFVQLANYMPAKEQPEDSNWALLRESQTETLKVPNTAQAVIIDLGEANDIHPRNKKDVGYRLALGAEKLAYGKDLVSSGPVFKNYKVEENKVTISFENVNSGLICKRKCGNVNGFAIAGVDKKFYWAKGIIKNNEVVIWSEHVKKPVYVRYAWADNPEDVNLYNKEELPATPFRFEIKD